MRRPSRRAAAVPEPVKKKDPRIASRWAWPEFYEQHKEDFDALYGIVTDRALQGSEALSLPGADEDEDEEESDSED